MQSAYAVNTCSVLDGGGLEGDWPIVGAARLGDEENSGNLFVERSFVEWLYLQLSPDPTSDHFDVAMGA